MSDPLSRERYYITDIFTSQDTPVRGLREEMEPGLAKELSARKNRNCAYINGGTAGFPSSCIVKYIAEEVSYMPDYEFNDRGEIEAVHYDPVPVVKRERAVLLKTRKGNSDTPLSPAPPADSER